MKCDKCNLEGVYIDGSKTLCWKHWVKANKPDNFKRTECPETKNQLSDTKDTDLSNSKMLIETTKYLLSSNILYINKRYINEVNVNTIAKENKLSICIVKTLNTTNIELIGQKVACLVYEVRAVKLDDVVNNLLKDGVKKVHLYLASHSDVLVSTLRDEVLVGYNREEFVQITDALLGSCELDNGVYKRR